jgi:parvulin-like peptidyl-prolyl isomerase
VIRFVQLACGRATLPAVLLAAGAIPAWAQYEQYPSTDDRQGGAPVVNTAPPQNYAAPYGNPQPQANPQPYGDPYARQYASPQNPYPTTDSLGPYDDYRQGTEHIQPDFSRQPQPQAPPPKLIEANKTIAIVGSQHILAGDLLADINQILKQYEGKYPQEELDKQRGVLMRKMLPQMIQTKMLYQEMVATLPDDALPQIEAKLAVEFDDKQLPTLMEKGKFNTAAELDAELRKFGSSIEKQRHQFTEQILARELIRQKVDKEPEVSHLEMLDHYRANQKDYEREARVRWEELCVWHKDFNSKSEAYREIASMGNRVLRGAAFSRVAREQSKGYTASDGGWHDWTTKGSLRAKELDEAIFTLPIDQLSQVIETEEGFHIIRVLDREDAGRVPFFKEQVRIKQSLQKEKRDAQVDEFLAQLQSRTRVWTVFDDAPPEDEESGE